MTADLHPRRGGPPRVVIGSALALRRLGVEVEVAAMSFPGDSQAVRSSWPELASESIPLHLFDRNSPKAAGYSRAMHRFVSSNVNRFEVLHVHGVWEQGLALAGRCFQRSGRPYFVSAHGMLDKWSISQSRTKKRIALAFLPTRAFLKQADAVVYGTGDEAAEAEHLRLGKRSTVVANGVDLHQFQAADRDVDSLRAAFPQVKDWKRTVLFYSRVHPKKGLDLLVKAFATVAHKHPGTGLLAVGIPEDDEYAAQVRALMHDMGLADKAVLTTDFTGRKGSGAFDLADIFVLPSHQEGFSMAIVEAMALAKPLLITDRCHMNFLQEAGAGLVTAATTDALAAGLDVLLSASGDELTRMGDRGRTIVQEQFTWDAVGLALRDLYYGGKRL